MSKSDNQPEKLVNFKIDSKLYESVFFIARELYGHGGVKKLYNVLSKEFVAKYDGKTAKLDTFLDSNFIPKPIAFDDIDKIVMPFASNLSDVELHNLRVWSFQVYNICMAYSKMSPLKRKNSKMSYDQLFDIANRD